jgi:hypothetical protein
MWLLRFICEIFVLCYSQAVNVKFCVLGYFAILRSVLNLLLLHISHFRADSTAFNPSELNPYYIIGFYVTSINFEIVQLRHNGTFHAGAQRNVSLWPRFPVSLCSRFNSNFVRYLEFYYCHTVLKSVWTKEMLWFQPGGFCVFWIAY